MKRIVPLLLVFSLGATWSRTAYADPVKPSTFPSCEVMMCGGVDACVYKDIDDWKLVLDADAELVLRRTQGDILTGQVASLRHAVTLLSTANIAEHDSRIAFEKRASDLSAQLKAKEVQYENERIKPHWGGITGWIAAGVLGAALGGVLVAQAVN